MSSICFCVSGFGCSCVPQGRFVLCGLASTVPDDCVKAQFYISPFIKEKLFANAQATWRLIRNVDHSGSMKY